MNLILEIEFLTGIYRGTTEPASDAPDWPPQPDRVFSALVSSWAARGEQTEERSALEWLETQPFPSIYAGECVARTTPKVFVPPNDFQTPKNDLEKLKWYRDFLAKGKRPPEKGGYERSWQRVLSMLPDNRQRKERQFPAAYLSDPVMALVWPEAPDTGLLEKLDAIARDVGYLGHSTSLVRFRFLKSDAIAQTHSTQEAQRCIYPGRLAELEQAHIDNPIRPVIRPGTTNPRSIPAKQALASRKWLVLEIIGGTVPDIRTTSLVCRMLRQALMSGYRRIGMANEIPHIVSGHDSDGKPTRLPHMAVVPMAFAGFPHADGRVLGFALIPPAQTELSEIPEFRAAFEKIAPYDQAEERRVIVLSGKPLREQLRLSPVGVTTKHSLSTEPYLKPSRIWASVTPVVLDRHLKRKNNAEIQEIIASACENTGLPRPNLNRIHIGKHSTVEGSPPVRFSKNAPPWTHWKIPHMLSTRSLVHVAIDFECETAGPVLLGAGRFIGMGMCRGLGG